MNRATLWAIAAATMLAITLAGRCHANEGEGTPGFCERHGCVAPTECPAPTVCPDVTCQATDCSKTTVVVNPTPCEFPDYVPCRKQKDGTLRCPRKKTPRRVLHPVTK